MSTSAWFKLNDPNPFMLGHCTLSTVLVVSTIVSQVLFVRFRTVEHILTIKDVRDRKLKPPLICSTVGKREKL